MDFLPSLSQVQSAVLDKHPHVYVAAPHLISSEDAVGAELLDGLPWNQDLKGGQRRGVGHRRSHRWLCEESVRGHKVRTPYAAYFMMNKLTVNVSWLWSSH